MSAEKAIGSAIERSRPYCSYYLYCVASMYSLPSTKIRRCCALINGLPICAFAIFFLALNFIFRFQAQVAT